ncbi:hypothetical protein HKD37_06G016460 [Glycine soja]
MALVIPGKVYQSPFPEWYNPNTTYAYHGGVLGHSIEQCVAFKHKVQSLIDVGWLTFQEDSQNVRTNPLANHGGSTVNAVEKWEPRGLKQMGDVSTSRRFILEALCEVGMIRLDGDKGDSCLMHSGASHNVETCSMAEEFLQGMMDKGQIEVCSARKGKGDVYMQSDDKNPSKPKPLVIHFTRDIATQKPRGFQPITVKKHAPFPYKNGKAMPWKYAAQGPDGRKDASVVHVKDDLSSTKVTNKSGMSGMTRSGWIFAAPELPVRSKNPKGKAKADVCESDKAGLTPNNEVPVGKIAKEGNNFSKKGIFTEFKVIEQLNKTPARISLLRLLMNSKPHRVLLVKILNEAHNRRRFGLGYEPTRADKRRVALKRKERSSAQPIPFCHIDESFVNAGWMCEGRVAVINRETPQDQLIWVRSFRPEFELGNWQVIKQSGISMANSISNNESCESSDTEDLDVDFKKLKNQAEKGEDED